MNETIWCIAKNCSISPAGCVTRQRNATALRPGISAIGHPGVGDFACRKCEQGRLVAAAIRRKGGRREKRGA